MTQKRNIPCPLVRPEAFKHWLLPQTKRFTDYSWWVQRLELNQKVSNLTALSTLDIFCQVLAYQQRNFTKVRPFLSQVITVMSQFALLLPCSAAQPHPSSVYQLSPAALTCSPSPVKPVYMQPHSTQSLLVFALMPDSPTLFLGLLTWYRPDLPLTIASCLCPGKFTSLLSLTTSIACLFSVPRLPVAGCHLASSCFHLLNKDCLKWIPGSSVLQLDSLHTRYKFILLTYHILNNINLLSTISAKCFRIIDMWSKMLLLSFWPGPIKYHILLAHYVRTVYPLLMNDWFRMSCYSVFVYLEVVRCKK